MNQLSFAPATPADLAAINQLVNGAYRGDSSKKGWTTEADLLDGIRTTEAQLQQNIETPDSIILTCRLHNQLAGCVFLQKQAHKMYLGMLTVDPTLQAHGIGKILMRQAEEHAKQKGCDTVTMTVITKRKELIDWYIRRGYHSTGEIKPFPNDPNFGIPKEPLEFIVMEKKLG